MDIYNVQIFIAPVVMMYRQTYQDFTNNWTKSWNNSTFDNIQVSTKNDKNIDINKENTEHIILK